MTWVAELDGTVIGFTAFSLFGHEGFKLIAAQTVQLRGQSFTNFQMEKWLNAAAV